MLSIFGKPQFVAAAVVVGAGLIAGAVAVGPAIAGGATPFSNITCGSASACQQYTNTGAGPGLEGKTGHGFGLEGVALKNGVGVYGQSQSGAGVDGNSQTGDGGAFGSDAGGYGIYAISFGSDGIYADADGGSALAGIVATSSGQGPGVLGVSYTSQPAIYAVGGSGIGLYSSSDGGPAIYGSNANGNGSDITGTYIGLLGRAPTGGFPLVATDSSGNNEFYVNGNGDVYYNGTLNSFINSRNGQRSTAFDTKSAQPSMDDWGTAQLVNGVATVRLDSTFAQGIDLRRAYQVMLTPDADTRGLFVAMKTPTAFVVKEVQGGHGTFAFDYHIYASRNGQAGQRMSLVSGSNIIGGPKAGTTRLLKPVGLPTKRHSKP